MRLIAGLGNPGDKYTFTRHNVGFLVLDAYLDGALWTSDHQGLVHKRKDTIFCKPMTFMNMSGESIRSIRNYFRIDGGDILVIVDDLHLPAGTFRLGFNKNAGGHNGLKSVIDGLGSRGFCTLRVGIGPREKADSIADYVLDNFTRESIQKIRDLYPVIFRLLEDFEGGCPVTELQNKYNR